MNLNESNYDAEDFELAAELEMTEPMPSDEELRSLAEDIVRYCPSLTHLLLAMGSKKDDDSNPLAGMN